MNGQTSKYGMKALPRVVVVALIVSRVGELVVPLKENGGLVSRRVDDPEHNVAVAV